LRLTWALIGPMGNDEVGTVSEHVDSHHIDLMDIEPRALRQVGR
jgi:hypothetical protein